MSMSCAVKQLFIACTCLFVLVKGCRDVDYNKEDLKVWERFFTTSGMHHAEHCYDFSAKYDPCCACSQAKSKEKGSDVYVKCKVSHGEQFITEIHMSNNNLNGFVNKGLTKLTKLRNLDLTGNNLSAPQAIECFQEKSLICGHATKCHLCADGESCGNLLCDQTQDPQPVTQTKPVIPLEKPLVSVEETQPAPKPKDSSKLKKGEDRGEAEGAEDSKGSSHILLLIALASPLVALAAFLVVRRSRSTSDATEFKISYDSNMKGSTETIDTAANRHFGQDSAKERFQEGFSLLRSKAPSFNLRNLIAHKFGFATGGEDTKQAGVEVNEEFAGPVLNRRGSDTEEVASVELLFNQAQNMESMSFEVADVKGKNTARGHGDKEQEEEDDGEVGGYAPLII